MRQCINGWQSKKMNPYFMYVYVSQKGSSLILIHEKFSQDTVCVYNHTCYVHGCSQSEVHVAMFTASG